MAVDNRILTLNAGSSSLRWAVFEGRGGESRLQSGRVDGDSFATVLVGLPLAGVGVVAHRVVHAGNVTSVPPCEWVSAAVLARLKGAVPLAPNHLPKEIGLIEAAERALPGVRQAVCYDTAFHQDLPAVAKRLPVPRRFEAEGVRRYGFHGLSYAYLMRELGRVAPEEAGGAVILAHLGSGSSLAAVLGGKPIDTTMGMTPLGGVMMGTRCGDLDPGVLIYLMRQHGLNADGLERLVSAESGLAGVSGGTSDIRRLTAMAAEGDGPARESIESYARSVSKGIGAMAAALGGAGADRLNTLVFAGGIGEHSGAVRGAICEGLGVMGIRLDREANAKDQAVISAGKGVTVRVIPTDEELMMAGEVNKLAFDPHPAELQT